MTSPDTAMESLLMMIYPTLESSGEGSAIAEQVIYHWSFDIFHLSFAESGIVRCLRHFRYEFSVPRLLRSRTLLTP
jgi:hypothetical protein